MSADLPDPVADQTCPAEPSRGSIGARRNPETETAVLDAAAAILAEEGYAKLTMEAVARRARSGKATVYRWWPSRGHLLLALYSRAKAAMPQPDTGSLRHDMEAYLTTMVRQWRGEGVAAPLGPLVRLLIAEAQLDETVSAAMQAERQANWHHIDDIIAHARARGEINASVSTGAAEMRIISLMWYRLLTDSLPVPEEIPQIVADLLAPLSVS